MARICPLFSGSSGNSYYIGSQDCGVLIDIGRSAKQTENILKLSGIGCSAVKAIFITHEHSDHICGVRVFAAKHNIPVFASETTLTYMEENGCTSEKTKYFPIYDETPVECAGMYIKPFETPHDSNSSCGYRIDFEDGRVATISTDLGHITDNVRNSLMKSDFAVIESNHDVSMLKNGPYPYYLKRRILSPLGHLSNDDCAVMVRELALSGTGRFMLAHLSRENNTPRTAFDRTCSELLAAGLKKDIDFSLMVAPIVNESGKSIIF